MTGRSRATAFSGHHHLAPRFQSRPQPRQKTLARATPGATAAAPLFPPLLLAPNPRTAPPNPAPALPLPLPRALVLLLPLKQAPNPAMRRSDRDARLSGIPARKNKSCTARTELRRIRILRRRPAFGGDATSVLPRNRCSLSEVRNSSRTRPRFLHWPGPSPGVSGVQSCPSHLPATASCAT